MRKYSESFIIYLIFGAIIIVFAVSFGPGGGSCIPGRGNYAVMVNGDSIPQATFARLYGRQVEIYRRNASASGMDFDADMIERLGLRKQIIDQLIEKKLLAQEARGRGLSVNDEELVQYLKTRYGVKEVSKQQYRSWIARSFQTTVAGFETDMRGEILGQKLERFVNDTVSVSEGEIKDDYLREHDRAMVSYVKFDTAESDIAEPSKAEIEKLLANDFAKVEASYNKEILKYRTPQKVRARQIMRKLPREPTDADVAKARGLLLDLKGQIDGGADFAALAKEHSEDEATKKEGGDMGLFARGQRIRAIEDAVFGMKKDELTAEPVRTRSGLHLLQVTEMQAPARKKLEEVKEEVASSLLLEDKREEVTRAKAEKILAKLQSGTAIDKVTLSEQEAKEKPNDSRPVRVETAWILESQKALPRIGASKELHDAIFALTTETPVAKKIYKVGRSYYAVVLKDRETPDLTKFDAEKETLREQAVWQKRSRLFRDWVAHLKQQARIQYNTQLFPKQGGA